MKRLITILLIMFFFLGCTQQDSVPQDEEKETPSDFIVGSSFDDEETVEENAPEGNSIVEIVTNKGTFKFELYEGRAPITTANFKKLAMSNFYDGLTFHRYEPGFVIQGGDPLGTGMGGSDEKIVLEINPELKHIKGAVAMARAQDPNSASSQFYVTLAPANFLDGNYAVFGMVTEGMDVVEQLRAGDKMETVRVIE